MNSTIYKIRLKVGDTVMVRSGKYKGQKGKVTAVHPKLNKVTVEGINIVTKHIKRSREYPKGDIVKLTKPIWVSKVGIVEASGKKPVKVAFKVTKEGKKTRIYSSSGKEIK